MRAISLARRPWWVSDRGGSSFEHAVSPDGGAASLRVQILSLKPHAT